MPGIGAGEGRRQSPKEIAGNVTPNAKDIKSEALLLAISRDPNLTTPDREPLEGGVLAQYIDQIIRFQQIHFERDGKNPYHNSAHLLEVIRRVRKLIESNNISADDAMLLIIAAAFHDYGHSGGAERKDKLSDEEFAAYAADKFVAEIGFSTKQRIKLYGLIIGTTFNNEKIEPHTENEKILAAADIAGFNNSFASWVLENANIANEGGQRFEDLNEWIDTRLSFIEKSVSILKKAPGAWEIWGDGLEKTRDILKDLRKNPTGEHMRAIELHIRPLLNN